MRKRHDNCSGTKTKKELTLRLAQPQTLIM